MKISINLPNFLCPDNMRPHLQKVFSGEYDIPYDHPAPRIIDLGANCGAFALWATHRWPHSRVYCYEPHPKIFSEFLEKNTELYYPKITIEQHAIGTPGVRALLDGTNNIGETSLYYMGNNTTLTGQHVEVHDPLSLPEADILKMDIEGCEVEVLRPLIEAGRKFDAILCEYHNEDLRLEIDSLLTKDYRLVKSEVAHINGRGTVCYIVKKLLGAK